ncbi:hypothetical protein P154DRAFT_612889, partial [Amniculicola lignicola CBS 123094]
FPFKIPTPPYIPLFSPPPFFPLAHHPSIPLFTIPVPTGAPVPSAGLACRSLTTPVPTGVPVPSAGLACLACTPLVVFQLVVSFRNVSLWTGTGKRERGWRLRVDVGVGVGIARVGVRRRLARRREMVERVVDRCMVGWFIVGV